MALVDMIVVAALLLVSCGVDDTSEPGWNLEDSCPASLECEEPRPELACGGNLPERTEFTSEDGNALRNNLALGPEGCPHVSYYQNGGLVYARWDGQTWRTERLDEFDAYWDHRLAVDEDGQPSIAFESGDHEHLMYAERDDSGQWQVVEIAQMYVWSLAYDLDPLGRPVIVTQHGSTATTLGGGEEVYAFRRHQDDWQREILMSEGNISYLPTSIVFDSSGRAHAALSHTMRSGEEVLYHARQKSKEGWRWEMTPVLQEPSGTYQSAVEVDGDTPHFLSCTTSLSEPNTVDHLYPVDDGWERETIDTCGDFSCWCGNIDLDGFGRPNALYGVNDEDLESSNVQLRHAVYDGSTWRSQDLGAFYRGSINMEVDARAGFIHVVAQKFPDRDERRVVYLRLDSSDLPSDNTDRETR